MTSYLKSQRLKAGLTLKQLAAKMGICPSNLNDYENGKSKPSLKTSEKIAAFFKCDLQDVPKLFLDEDYFLKKLK